MTQELSQDQGFDIRRHLPDDYAAEADNQRFFNRFNLFMAIIGDLTFRELLTSKPQDLMRKLASRLQGPHAPLLRVDNAATLLDRIQELVHLCGERTGKTILSQCREDDATLADAIEAVRKEGLLLPPLQKGMNSRQKYLGGIVMSRIVHTLGHFTPRDLFEKRRIDGSSLERSVILEAKMAGFFGASSCGGNGDPPPVNNQVCVDIGEGLGVCQPKTGSNCIKTRGGFCSLISDEPEEPDGPDGPDVPVPK